MSPLHDHQENEFDYQADFNRPQSSTPKTNRKHRPQYSRSGKSPQSFNGMHRRRKNRWSW